MGRPFERFVVFLQTIQILDQLAFSFLISVEDKYDLVYWCQLTFSVLFFLSICLQIKFDLSIRLHTMQVVLAGTIVCIIQMTGVSSLFYFTGTFKGWQPWLQLFFMLFNIFCNAQSWRMILLFGDCDLSSVQYTGNYAIGYKKFYIKESKNPVGVYYPVDKNYEKEVIAKQGTNAYKAYLDYKNQEGYLKGLKLAINMFELKEKPDLNTSYEQFQKKIMSKALKQANLAEQFASGKEQLIPVIYSHGVCMTGHDYQMAAHELAANGHIVFCLTHLDGSSCYAELEDGSTRTLNMDLPTPHPSIFTSEDQTDAKPWLDTITCREKEMSNLIDDILEETFLKNVLNFGSDCRIDAQKIIVIGHSHGGATVLKVGDSDSRIKCVISHDPWTDLLLPWIDSMNELIKKPFQICQSQFLPHEEQFTEDLHKRLTTRIVNNGQFENILVDKTHHIHQSDASLLFGLELDLFIIEKKYKEPSLLSLPRSSNLTNIFQYFIHLTLKFLHNQKLTSSSGSSLAEIEKRLERFKNAKKGETGYVYDPADGYYEEHKNELKKENSSQYAMFEDLLKKRLQKTFDEI